MDIREQNYNTLIRGFKFIDKYGNEGWLYFHDNNFIFTKDLITTVSSTDYVQYTYYTDGNTRYRQGVRDDYFVVDKFIDSGSLALFNAGEGTEGVDYELVSRMS